MSAVRCGNDTDTVGAIAGSLAGAKWGGCSVPALWRRELHRRLGLRADDLARLVELVASGDRLSFDRSSTRTTPSTTPTKVLDVGTQPIEWDELGRIRLGPSLPGGSLRGNCCKVPNLRGLARSASDAKLTGSFKGAACQVSGRTAAFVERLTQSAGIAAAALIHAGDRAGG